MKAPAAAEGPGKCIPPLGMHRPARWPQGLVPQEPPRFLWTHRSGLRDLATGMQSIGAGAWPAVRPPAVGGASRSQWGAKNAASRGQWGLQEPMGRKDCGPPVSEGPRGSVGPPGANWAQEMQPQLPPQYTPPTGGVRLQLWLKKPRLLSLYFQPQLHAPHLQLMLQALGL